MEEIGRGERSLILPEQLRRARGTVYLSVEEVANRLGIGSQEIEGWEAGRGRPSLRQLEHLSELYGRELDYFLRETPSPPTELQFRSAAERSFAEVTPEARLVIARFDELCRGAWELERLLGKMYTVAITTATKGRDPAVVAREQREGFGFDNRPIGKLRDRLAQRGVRIFELPVPEGQFSGFSYWHRDYGPCILINAKDVLGRRNFTLAHEYGHLLYHQRPFVCDIPGEGRIEGIQEERTANVFAIEFLLPAASVKEDFERRGLRKKPALREIGKLAGRWGVSVQAMMYRLEELGLIARGWAEGALRHYQPPRGGFRRPKIATWERRLGSEFVHNALEAYQGGHISMGKLADYLGLPLRRAYKVAEGYREPNKAK